MAQPTERRFIAQPSSAAAGRVIASPFQFFTTGEEALRVTSACSVTGARVALHYRFLDPDAGIVANREQHTPNSDRTARSEEYPLGAGALLNLTVFADVGTPKLGQCFVRVQLIRGRGAAAVVMATIAQGYVTANQDLAWPGSTLDRSVDGPGVIRSILGTDPVGGVEIAETVPTGALWELLGLSTLMFVDVAAGDRIPRLVIVIDGQVYFRAPINPPIPPAGAALLTWYTGANFQTAHDGGACCGTLPDRLFLPAGTNIVTVTANLAALDNYSAPRLLVREWLEVN